MKTQSKYKVKEVTPESMRCVPRGACPAIYETDEDTFIIVGRELSQEELKLKEFEMIKKKIGKDETAIVVPKELIEKRKRKSA